MGVVRYMDLSTGEESVIIVFALLGLFGKVLQDKRHMGVHQRSSLMLKQLFNNQYTLDSWLFTREVVAAVQRGQISSTPTVVAMHQHSLLWPVPASFESQLVRISIL